MKKKFFGAICLLICLSVLASCGEGDGTQSGDASGADVSKTKSQVSAQSYDSPSGDYSEIVPDGEMLIRFINVGEADAIIIMTSDCVTLLDTGLSSTVGLVTSELDALGVKTIDNLIITHFDKDHFGGAEKVLENYTVRRAILGPDDNTSKKIAQMLDAIDEEGIKPEYAKVGQVYDFGGAEFHVLGPYGSIYEQENDYSLVGMLTWQGKKALFAGDAEAVSLTEMLDRDYDELDADIIKVPHHGRYNRMTPAFIGAVSPQYAVICNNDNPDENIPEKKVLSALASGNTEYFITGNGTVDIRINAEGITAKQENS